MIPTISQQMAFALVAKLEAVALLISCIEYLATPKILQDTGLMSWEVSRFRNVWLLMKPVKKTLDLGFAYPNVLCLLLLESLLAGVVVLAPSAIATNPWIIGPMATLLWLFIMRSGYGHDGADQMQLILLVGLWIVAIVHTPTTIMAYLWFIAFQGCLSYATAGFAKATEKGWRDGTYLVGICNTAIYGNTMLGSFLASHPTQAKWFARLVIFWECTFALVLVVPHPLVLIFLASGVLFHLVNGYFMGLNTFLWAFVATYPAILYCVQLRGW